MATEMTTELSKPVGKFDPNQTITFDVNTEEIDALRDKYMGLVISGPDDSAGYDKVHEARMVCVRNRTTVEKQRKDYKADALAYGRSVDAAAKAIVALIEPVERHLVAQEQAYKEAHERIKREAEEAKRKVLQERLDKLAAVGCTMNSMVVECLNDEDFAELLAEKAEAHRIIKEREAAEAAEAKRLAEEEEAKRKAEADRLAAERKALEEERRQMEVERAERQKLIDEQERKLREQQQQIDAERRRVEAEQQARERAAELERQKVEAAERARIETEQRLKREAEELQRKADEEAAYKLRQEQLRPDRDKLLSVADAVAGIMVPDVSEDLLPTANAIRNKLRSLAAHIRDLVEHGQAQATS